MSEFSMRDGEQRGESGGPNHYGAYRLRNGDTAYLTRLSMSRTYDGLVCGTLERASEEIRRVLAENVARDMAPGKPLVILDNGARELPEFMWMAKFQTSSEKPDFGSRLYVCWFSDAIGQTASSDPQAIFEAADFEANAEEWDWYG